MSIEQRNNNIATLSFGEEKFEIPYVKGSEEEIGLDISKLRGQSGAITLDIGFKNTGSTTSSITFLDGENGILRHRGYAIEDLTRKVFFFGSGLSSDLWRFA